MKKYLILISILLIAAFLLGACSPKAAVIETPTEEEQVAEEPAAPQEELLEEEVAESKVGGTFVWVVEGDPDTLDPHKTHSSISDTIMALLGTSLVAINPQGEIVPYAAESWTTSEDGLVWEFTLRQDIKFHDGTALTAQDFAWTYQRALDPETASPAAASMLGSLVSVEALDDYTLRMTLSEAYFPFLLTLASPGYLQPLSQAVMEEMGEEVFAHNPVGTGPYVFKEWVTGDRVVLERNPDYTWGPGYTENSGPYNIETIEFRIIPEYATQLAGLESGDLDVMNVETKDMGLFLDNPEFDVYELPFKGIEPYVAVNVSAAPFDDINVRKAFNLSLNRQTIVDIMLGGNGVIQYGPISAGVLGYWPGVEEIGYRYDLEQAEVYMQEAGYERNADNLWEKDGEVFYLPLVMVAGDDKIVRLSQILQEQWKQFGVDVELIPVDRGVYGETVLADENYVACIANWGYSEADLLYLIFHSSMIGALNVHRLNDAEFDAMLERTRTEIDPAERQKIVNEVQEWLVKNAVVIPLYTPVQNYVVSSKVKDVIFSRQFGLFLNDAYIEE